MHRSNHTTHGCVFFGGKCYLKWNSLGHSIGCHQMDRQANYCLLSGFQITFKTCCIWPLVILIALSILSSQQQKMLFFACHIPHTTAYSQPLDTSCYGPLKTYWFEIYPQYLFSNPGQVTHQLQFVISNPRLWRHSYIFGDIDICISCIQYLVDSYICKSLNDTHAHVTNNIITQLLPDIYKSLR